MMAQLLHTSKRITNFCVSEGYQPTNVTCGDTINLKQQIINQLLDAGKLSINFRTNPRWQIRNISIWIQNQMAQAQLSMWISRLKVESKYLVFVKMLVSMLHKYFPYLKAIKAHNYMSSHTATHWFAVIPYQKEVTIISITNWLIELANNETVHWRQDNRFISMVSESRRLKA